MVDSHVVLQRIDKIRECVAKLQRFSVLSEDAFLNDSLAVDSAERNLQIAIQAVIDISNHVAADMDLGTPKDYKDIFELLARNNIISEPLSRKLISMTGLRNVLVHDYLEVNLHLIYKIIKSELGDFEEFVAAALKLV